MSRVMLVGLLLMVGLAGSWALMGESAKAQPAFKLRWDKKYFYEESPMKKAYGMSSCNFCHIGGIEDRKHRNEYGQALSKFIKKADADNLTPTAAKKTPDLYKKTEEKVLKAFEEVEKLPSNPKDKDSPTFGALLKEGKLPKSPAVLPAE